MSPTYAVIIPFFKDTEQLAKCKQALPPDAKVFVVDDSETSRGFTSTVNQGIVDSLASSESPNFLIILNQDCYLKPNAVDEMLKFMEAHPRCAIGSIKQLSDKNSDEIIHGGTTECFPAGKHLGGSVRKGDCALSKQMPWANGACMVVRTASILSFGLLDNNMRMFASDADWSYTARSRGWEVWYIASAVCVHEQGASKSRDAQMDQTFQDDMRYFRDKWLNGELYRDLSLEIF